MISCPYVLAPTTPLELPLAMKIGKESKLSRCWKEEKEIISGATAWNMLYARWI